MATWFSALVDSKKTSIVQDGRTKIHYTFADGKEMTEQYDNRTETLIERKWKTPTTLGGEGTWNYEVGQASQQQSTLLEDLKESSANPIFCRCDTKQFFQWRIRNLPYPIDTYKLSVEDGNESIVLRTTNKKYFKRFNIPDLHRIDMKLQESELSLQHSYNTLIISYNKPSAYLNFEKELRKELAKVKPLSGGDAPCASM